MSGHHQEAFLRAGGALQGVLQQKYETGELDPNYVWREYPKALRISRGVQTFRGSAEVIRNGRLETQEWSEEREVFEDIIVQSEEEEERVLAGGKTAAQVEDERQTLIAQARARGIQVDASWGLARLQREIGTAPSSEAVEALRMKVADLEEKAALRRQIADLEAQLAGKRTPAPDNPEELRAQLAALGIDVDRRWGVQRLREELDAATAP